MNLYSLRDSYVGNVNNDNFYNDHNLHPLSIIGSHWHPNSFDIVLASCGRDDSAVSCGGNEQLRFEFHHLFRNYKHVSMDPKNNHRVPLAPKNV